MPYCPECRDEFQEWVKVCPDCKVTLVKELPALPEREESNEPLVHVATAPNDILQSGFILHMAMNQLDKNNLNWKE